MRRRASWSGLAWIILLATLGGRRTRLIALPEDGGLSSQLAQFLNKHPQLPVHPQPQQPSPLLPPQAVVAAVRPRRCSGLGGGDAPATHTCCARRWGRRLAAVTTVASPCLL